MNWEEKDYYPDTSQKALYKEFKFKDFAEALTFVNKIGTIAEELGHHPDIRLMWGKVVVCTTSHDAHKITNQDYDLAKKIDQISS